MGYEKTVHAEARRILQERRRSAVESAARTKSEIHNKLPRTAEIDRELAGMSSKIVRAVVGAGGSTIELLEGLKLRALSLSEERAALLKEAGLPEDIFDTPYHCKACEDTGIVGNERCSCYRELLKQIESRNINRISNMQLCRFDDFDLDYYSREGSGDWPSPYAHMQSVLEYCRNYAAGFTGRAPSLLMMGATGLGKTHLSLAIAGEVIFKGHSVMYGAFGMLCQRIESEKFGERQGNTLDSLLACDLLILDDLGSEFCTPFVVSTLYTLVNGRLNAGKPTIINTNCGFEELQKLYTDRMVSRLRGSYVALPFAGSDVRIAKAREEQHR